MPMPPPGPMIADAGAASAASINRLETCKKLPTEKHKGGIVFNRCIYIYMYIYVYIYIFIHLISHYTVYICIYLSNVTLYV